MKYKHTISTPLGFMRAVTTDDGLCRLLWQQQPFNDADSPDYVSRETTSQLDAYLAGRLTESNQVFHYLPLPKFL